MDSLEWRCDKWLSIHRDDNIRFCSLGVRLIRYHALDHPSGLRVNSSDKTHKYQ